MNRTQGLLCLLGDSRVCHCCARAWLAVPGPRLKRSSPFVQFPAILDVRSCMVGSLVALPSRLVPVLASGCMFGIVRDIDAAEPGMGPSLLAEPLHSGRFARSDACCGDNASAADALNSPSRFRASQFVATANIAKFTLAEYGSIPSVMASMTASQGYAQ